MAEQAPRIDVDPTEAPDTTVAAYYSLQDEMAAAEIRDARPFDRMVSRIRSVAKAAGSIISPR